MRNCQTRFLLDSAIRALQQPADFAEWIEAWSRYTAAAVKLNVAMLPNMAGHFAFMVFSNRRLASKALLAHSSLNNTNPGFRSDV